MISRIQKLTLIDYPGRLACTVFLTGCNFNCPWCYSPELVLKEKIKDQPKIKEKELFDFLEEKKGLIEGVVLCGGEPTLQKDLEGLIKKIKDMDYLVKLDTNGSDPRMIEDLIKKKLVDYIAMDIKLPKERYKELFLNTDNIQKSIDVIKKGRVDYEFRTTVVPEVLKREDILSIAEWLRGAERYYLQQFRGEKTLDPKFLNVKPYSDTHLLKIKKEISKNFKACDVR